MRPNMFLVLDLLRCFFSFSGEDDSFSLDFLGLLLSPSSLYFALYILGAQLEGERLRRGQDIPGISYHADAFTFSLAVELG